MQRGVTEVREDGNVSAGAVLRRTQRNEVLEVLVDVGLEPGAFSWQERIYSSGPVVGPAELVVHNDTGYFFEFVLRDGSKHWARMSPAPEAFEGAEYPGSWEMQLGYVRRWAADLRAELDAPDLWTSIASWESLVEVPPSFEENAPFADHELVELGERLDQIGNRLAHLVNREDLRSVAEDLVDHLRQEAPRQGRRDWFFLALGTLLSFMVNAAFDPMRAREMIDLLVTGVRSIGTG